MESNNYILGRIPGNSGGIHKTYEESIIMKLHHLNYRELFNNGPYDVNNPFKLYYSKSDKSFVTLRKKHVELSEEKDNYNEYEIINLYIVGPENVIVEVIDKKILHQHLLSERMIIERILRKEEELNL